MLSDLFQGFAEFFCATFCNFTAKIPKMSEHSLKRQLKVLTVPVFIEIALVMMLGAVDTVMLSRYSDNSVAAKERICLLITKARFYRFPKCKVRHNISDYQNGGRKWVSRTCVPMCFRNVKNLGTSGENFNASVGRKFSLWYSCPPER